MVQENPKNDHRLHQVYTLTPLAPSIFPVIDQATLFALNTQRSVLKYKAKPYNKRIGNLAISHTQLYETLDLLTMWQHVVPIGIERQLDAYQIWGNNRMGKVRFTGYFAPIIKASKELTPTFRYPIYGQPLYCTAVAPTRKEIEEGAIRDCAEIIAYASNKVDIYYMQLQGSGYIEYPNGKSELLAFAGQNGHPYKSIESYL
ncbi:MAG: hypothetical protein HC912_10385, partial [Saprospiraceae bacterium]|nr:hypothetical protein [Saprospiraceae bacterium]